MSEDHTRVDRRTFLKATGAAGGAVALGGVGHATGERRDLLVGYSAATPVDRVRDRLPASARSLRHDDDLGYLLVRVESSSVYERTATASRIADIEGVRYVEPDGEAYALGTAAGATTAAAPDDPKFPEQYAPQQVNASAAWNTTRGEDVTIAVVDQGVKYDHPDLADRFGSTKGQDFVSEDDDPYPEDMAEEYHGTHVAGIAAATTGNGEGVAGVSDATLLSGRALDASGSGNFSDIADAVKWAADQGADVINMSLGGGGRNETMKQAVQYAVNNGALPVCAAGNSGLDSVSYPARFQECVAVGALDENQELARFSQYGENLDVVGPGVDVLSCWTEQGRPYNRISGTSMSCPAAAGVAALGLGAHPSAGPEQLRALLRGTAVDVGLPGNKQGYGRVDAAAIVRASTGNFAPSAAFTVDADHPDPGQSIGFDAAASSDPEESIASYEWAFGDGTTATGETASHAFESTGEYTVSLTVTDDRGNADTTEKTLRVRKNEAPHAVIAPPNPDPVVGESVYFRARYSEDDDGKLESYEWDFGDGTTAEGGFNHHTYQEAGEYEVTLTVTDDDGATDTATTTATVKANDAPTAAFSLSSETIHVDDSLTVDASGSSDEVGGIEYYHWDFGDDTSERNGDATEQHAYDAPGEYTVTLEVEDKHGRTDTTERTVTVTGDNQPPEATLEPSATVLAPGEVVTLDASGSSDPDGSVESYDWKMGDGTGKTGELVEYSYDGTGEYEVTLTVTDDGGAVDSASTTVTVESESGGSDCGDPTARRTITRTIEEGEDATFEYDVRTADPCRVVLDLDGDYGTDLDLYATADGRTPSASDFDYRSWNYGPEERIEVDRSDLSGDATVGIMVDAYSGDGEFELVVKEAGAGGDGGNGGGDDGGSEDCGVASETTSRSGSLSGEGDRSTFDYEPTTASPCQVTVTLTGPDGADFDLFVTTDGSTPDSVNYDHRSTTRDSEERVVLDDPSGGDSYGIAVDAYAGSGEFTLRVEELSA